MKGYFDMQIAPLKRKLDDLIGDELVNDPHTYTDDEGITHIFIMDSHEEYKLVDGEWLEQPPF